MLRRTPLRPVGANHPRHFCGVPVPANDQPLHLVGDQLAVRGHRGRFEQPDEFGERLGPAIVRGRGRQDQRVGVRGQDAGQPVVLGRRIGDVVRLVDDHRVPGVLAQVGREPVLLEGVHRDDHPVEVGEGVAGRRQFLLDPLHPDRVEPHERDREPAPHLVLHLLQHVAGANDQDALTASASDQLRQDHADLERLAQPDRVGQQQPGPDRFGTQRPPDGRMLVLQRVCEGVHGYRQAIVRQRQRRLADGGFEPETCVPVAGRGIRAERGAARVQRLDGVEGRVEGRRCAADQVAQPLHGEQLPIVRGAHLRDQPLLIAHDDDGSGGQIQGGVHL